MTLRIANTDFDRTDYDADADVLYLAVGDPAQPAARQRHEGVVELRARRRALATAA